MRFGPPLTELCLTETVYKFPTPIMEYIIFYWFYNPYMKIPLMLSQSYGKRRQNPERLGKEHLGPVVQSIVSLTKSLGNDL